MEHWKRALIAGSAGASVILFLKGKRSAGVLLGTVGLVALAATYPERYAEVRGNVRYYAGRGMNFLDLVARAGERLAEAAKTYNLG